MTAVRVFSSTDPGIVRPDNEDSVFVMHGRMRFFPTVESAITVDVASSVLVIAVSDGMGGVNAGEIASALSVEALGEHMGERGVQGSAAEVLRSGFEHAHECVRNAAAGRPERSGMGTTLVAALIESAHATIALVGDSRAYVLRLGRLSRLTRDQTFVQALVDCGQLSPDQAESFPHKSVILQSIGHSETIDPAILELPLRRGDRLLLCSDGLTNELTDLQIEAILAAGDDPTETCASLISAANARGGRDNVSVAVAFIDGDDLPPPSRADVPPTPPPSKRFLY